MKTKLFAIIIFAAIAGVVSAQNARSILDKASEAYNATGGLTAGFTLNAKDPRSKSVNSYDGKAYMKGDKFKIEIPDAITWFNGTTQWVYVKDTEEVNVTTPTNEELQAISPSALFNIYKKGFNLLYKGEKKAAGKTLQEVELTPQKKGGDFTKIIVQIDKTSNIFYKVTLIDKSGLENELIIKNYLVDKNLSDNLFRFEKKDYPDADIIDLR